MSLSKRRQSAVLLLAAAACWSCALAPRSSDSSEPPGGRQTTKVLDREAAWGASGPQTIAPTLHRLRWTEDVTLRPPAHERVAQGPSAIAITADGSALILDRLAGQVLRVGRDGQVGMTAPVPVDSTDLTVGKQDRFATYSPVRARAWFFDRSGRPTGEMPVTRQLRELRHVQFGLDGSLWGHTMYQERFALGSPRSQPQLPALLASKREGAFALRHRTSVDTLVEKGRAVLRLLAPPEAGKRATVEARMTLPHAVSASRIIGIWSSIVCLRTEHVSGRPAISVRRRLTCVDVDQATLKLDEDLGLPGLYLPHRELTMQFGTVAQLLPRAEALIIKSWRMAP